MRPESGAHCAAIAGYVRLTFSLTGTLIRWTSSFPLLMASEQELIRFDRKNGWNGDILAAAKELLSEVSDPSVASSLVRLIEDLSPQNAPANRRKPIPARHRAWKPLHELCVDVLGGLGLDYRQGQAHAPGYLVNTPAGMGGPLDFGCTTWFWAQHCGASTGLPPGTKTKISTGAVTKLSVYPDCVIEPDGARPRMLLDAKYKGHVEKGNFGSVKPTSMKHWHFLLLQTVIELFSFTRLYPE